MYGAVVYVGMQLPTDSVLTFTVMVATGVVVYGATIVAMELWGDYGIRDVFRTLTNAVGE
jgi:PST family polysaccharide transporter/lipopolysaccharide exporter